jgi:HEAT repeat protein
MRIGRIGRCAVAGTIVALFLGCEKDKLHQKWTTKNESLSPSPVTLSQPRQLVMPETLGSEPAELRSAALGLLVQASTSSNALLRNQVVESLQQAPDLIGPVVQRGLVDENRAVRFSAAMTIGQLRLTELAHLLEPLRWDDSESVQAAAIFSLRKCGLPTDINPLSRMILSDDPEVRGNAALVLGLLGDRSATKLIQYAIGRGLSRVSAARVRIVELQMAEALVRLGHEESIQAVRAALFAPAEQGEMAALACLMCGELRDGGAVPDLTRLARRGGRRRLPAEVRMAATLALAQIGAEEVPSDVPLEYVHSEEFQLRQQAAITLGWIAVPASLTALKVLLSDPNPLVQVAAAGGIVRLTSPASS